MRELSLHILDIAENGVTAGADRIQILIDEARLDDHLKIVIQDNGSGLPPEKRDKLTDPFVTSRTTRRVGLGLPLLAAAMTLLLSLTMAMRYWVVATLGKRWSTRVIWVPNMPLVRGGPYRWMRHPQYTGIFLFTLGWILHWPSVVTLALWPVMIGAYVWLARYEERQAAREFGAEWEDYAGRTKRFVPGVV